VLPNLSVYITASRKYTYWENETSGDKSNGALVYTRGVYAREERNKVDTIAIRQATEQDIDALISISMNT
jgi:hypothetical protein